MQWIDIDGSVIVGAQGIANNAHIPVEDIALVLQGKSLADMSRLVFRDPNHFRAGKLHRHTPQWLSLIDDLNDDRFSEVRDWITNGVDVTKFFRPFKGVVTKERFTSAVLHCVVFSPITCHANRLPHLYLIRSWTVCVLGLFPCGVKSENAPLPTSFYPPL